MHSGKARCSIFGAKVGRPKSEEKRANILDAASELFLSHGFTGTSMDLVANQAGVSKQTVYSHFSNKDALFVSVIEYKCAQYKLDEAHMGDDQDPPKGAMISFGNQIMSLMQDEQVVAMHRVVIGELDNDPHVAELFYMAGPQHGLELMSRFMQRNVHLKLQQEEAYYWSCAFFNMLKGDFHLRSLLGLPFSMSESTQLTEVTRVTDHILSMIQLSSSKH